MHMSKPLSAGTTSWLAMAGAVRSPAAAVVATLLGSLSTACSDVVVDSIVVERSRGAPQVLSTHTPSSTLNLASLHITDELGNLKAGILSRDS